MGCICSKSINPDEDPRAFRSKSSKRIASLSKKDEVVATNKDVSIERNSGGSARFRAQPVENYGVNPPQHTDQREKKYALSSGRMRRIMGHQRVTSVDSWTNKDGLKIADIAKYSEPILQMPNAFDQEYNTAGWPSWLTNVAGEAIKNWLPLRANSFEQLDKIGQGTYSSVYRALDRETGKIVALKKVRFVNTDPESVRFMAREIHILRTLDHPNIIKLQGIISSRTSTKLCLVFEYMDHDLAGIMARPGNRFTEPQVKCFMRQLLEGLEHCHSHGVLHRDIKGSNLLIDSNGILKIGDFGLANFFNPDKKQPLTSHVVTLWYRPPELLLGATEYGVAVDLWSSGCILAELLSGKPIMPGRTQVEQLHKIFKLCGSPSDEYWNKLKLPPTTDFKTQRQYRRCIAEIFKDFPPSALSLLDTLLAIEPDNRGTVALALQSEFFTTEPFACDPSSLPKYPPSKEYDAKLREEKARRQRTKASNPQGSETVQFGRRDSRKVPGSDSNVEMEVHGNLKNNREKYNTQDVDGSGIPINPPRITAQNGFHQSSMQPNATSGVTEVNHNGQVVPARSYSSVRVSNGAQSKTQNYFAPQLEKADFTNFPSSEASSGMANSIYNGLEVTEPFKKLALDRPSFAYNKDSSMGYGNNNKRIHLSGPLMPPGGNMEEMLKEHERQIQQAVRKARLDKVKS